MIKIKKNSTTKETLKAFNDAYESGEGVNMKTKKGHIFLVGQILSKLEGKDQYFAIDGKWVKV